MKSRNINGNHIMTILASQALLLLTFFAYSQNPTLKFKKLTTSDGLSYNSIKLISQDHKGYIWFGSDMGLNRYDGVKFHVYTNTPNDSTSISSNVIKIIYEDSNRNLWIGTSAGLDLYDRAKDSFIHYKISIKDQVNAICEDHEKNLWIGTLHGEIYKFITGRGEIKHCKDLSEAGIKPSITYLYQDKQGEILIGTENELKVVVKDKLEVTYKKVENLDLRKINFIYEDDKNNIWFTSNGNGLICHNQQNKSSVIYTHHQNNINSISSNVTFSIVKDDYGKYWIGTENGGLNIFDPDKKMFYRYLSNESDNESISSNSVYSIFKDRSSNIWVGTMNGGINFLKRNKFDHYKHKSGEINAINNDIVLSVAEDKNGDLWFGTDGGGLNFYDRKNGKFVHYTHDDKNKNSISNNFVTGVSIDKKGNIWTCFWDGGVDLFDREKKIFIHHKHDSKNTNTPANNSIWDVLEDRDGDILMATVEGLDVYDPQKKTYTHYTPANSDISSQYVFDIFQDSEGLIWIGTVHGFNLFDKKNKSFRKYLANDKDPYAINDNVVSSIMEDSKGNLWLGTQKGVNIFNKKTNQFYSYREQNGLASDMIAAVVEDNNGNMWISTTNGICMFDSKKKIFARYNVSDGLQDAEFKRNAALKTSKGELLFGGIKGYNIFIPDSLKMNSFSPPIFISDFKIFNKPVVIGASESPLTEHISQIKELTLSYKHSIFSFDFVALDYVSPEKNQYSYKMEGLDKEWIFSGTNKSATYTYLEPGEYVFRVKGSNNDGVWNEEGASLKIIITPPFWQTLWFKSFIILLILGSAVSFYKVRMNAIKKQKAELEKQVLERTTEVIQQKEELKVQAENLIAINANLHEKQEEIEMQRDNLEKINDHVMSSLKYANTIQKALLPSINKIEASFKDSFIIYRPKDVVSGDFYWFADLPREKTNLENSLTFIAAVDCTGHGVPGAFMSIIGSTLLNEIVNQKHVYDPALILNELNIGVKQAIDKAEGVNTAGMDVCLCVLEKGEENYVKLLYTGAKRPLYIVRPSAGEIERLEGDRKSIGSESKSTVEFTTQELILEAGSLLYLTTDGYTDQNNPEREKLGSEKFKDLIKNHYALPAEEQKRIFEKSLDDHQLGSEQRDDITLIAIKI